MYRKMVYTMNWFQNLGSKLLLNTQKYLYKCWIISKDLVTVVIIYLVKIWQDLCLKLKPKTKIKNQFFFVDISTFFKYFD